MRRTILSRYVNETNNRPMEDIPIMTVPFEFALERGFRRPVDFHR